jgi:hypothetical protein
LYSLKLVGSHMFLNISTGIPEILGNNYLSKKNINVIL